MADQAQLLREMFKGQTGVKKLRVISVTSGKGGVGKSSISINLAICLSRLGYRVLLVDADFGLANIDVMLGTKVPGDFSDIIRGVKTAEEIIAVGHGGVKFISGGSGVYDIINMDDLQLEALIGSLLHLENVADILIFDTGAGVNDHVLKLLAASSEVLLVTTPEPTSIMDAYALLKTLYHRGAGVPVRLVINRADTQKEGETAQESFRQIAKKYMGVEVDSLGIIPYGKDMIKAVKMQVPVIVSFPTSPISRAIEEIALKFSRRAASERPSGSLRQFFMKFLGR